MYMSFLEQYQALYKRAEAAVKDALDNEVATVVKDIMEEQTGHQVYSYDASAMAMATRRVDQGGLGDKRFMVHDVTQMDSDFELTVEDTVPFQGSPVDYTTLTDVVERGTAEFNQPYPRPFVAGTETEAVSSGRALAALRDGLKRQGF